MAHNKEKVVGLLMEAFAFGADITAACAYAEINRDTYYDWCKKDPALREKSDRFMEKPMLKAYQTIARDLDKPEMAKWYAERKRRKEFATRQELTGEDGKDLVGENKEVLTKLDSILDKID